MALNSTGSEMSLHSGHAICRKGLVLALAGRLRSSHSRVARPQMSASLILAQTILVVLLMAALTRQIVEDAWRVICRRLRYGMRYLLGEVASR